MEKEDPENLEDLEGKFYFSLYFTIQNIMAFGKTITFIGVSLLVMYIIIQILTFYGVDQSAYGIYLVFFLFILLSILILPNNDPTLNMLKTLKSSN